MSKYQDNICHYLSEYYIPRGQTRRYASLNPCHEGKSWPIPLLLMAWPLHRQVIWMHNDERVRFTYPYFSEGRVTIHRLVSFLFKEGYAFVSIKNSASDITAAHSVLLGLLRTNIPGWDWWIIYRKDSIHHTHSIYFLSKDNKHLSMKFGYEEIPRECMKLIILVALLMTSSMHMEIIQLLQFSRFSSKTKLHNYWNLRLILE